MNPNPAKLLLQLFTFELFLLVAFALASNENSTFSNNTISNTYCDNATHAETCDVVAKILKEKRELSDAPTILLYVAVTAFMIIPQIPQIDV
jgi:hypothetical protein